MAENVGEWAFYIALVLMVMALLKRIPYHWFAKLHTYLALTYLALAYHAVVLVKYSYWTQPVGWLTAAFLIGGTVSAFIVLFKRTGHSRKTEATIQDIEYAPQSRILTLNLTAPNWPGHQAGQFLFLRPHHSSEAPHPYTIAGAWPSENHRLTLKIKALGDHTASLPQTLAAGQTATLEGPYGRFTFGGRERQIWISGGIGITPFIARMEALAAEYCSNPPSAIDLYHSTVEADPAEAAALQAQAAAAGITLHLHTSSTQGFLTAAQIRSRQTDWQSAGIWFCGPAAFARDLGQDFAANGFEMKHFHQELFEMR